MDPLSFDRMSRDELVAKGRSLGVERPELMTRVELGDEIVRRSQSDPNSQRSARGWLGIARDLVASVVESGLNLPDAAAVIRGDRPELETKVPAPVATVTLAEIYATQGHVDRALTMLNEVLEREPEHPAASALRERLREQPSRRASGARVGADVELEQTAPVEPVVHSAASVSATPVAAAASAEVDSSAGSVNDAPLPKPVASPALLVVRTDRAHPVVCWQLSSLEVPAGGAGLEIECLGFVAANARPERREVALQIESLRGSAVLTEFDAQTVVRAALGYRLSGAFVPVAIGSELVVRNGAIDVHFRPPLAPNDTVTEAERVLVAEFTG